MQCKFRCILSRYWYILPVYLYLVAVAGKSCLDSGIYGMLTCSYYFTAKPRYTSPPNNKLIKSPHLQNNSTLSNLSGISVCDSLYLGRKVHLPDLSSVMRLMMICEYPYVLLLAKYRVFLTQINIQRPVDAS